VRNPGREERWRRIPTGDSEGSGNPGDGPDSGDEEDAEERGVSEGGSPFPRGPFVDDQGFPWRHEHGLPRRLRGGQEAHPTVTVNEIRISQGLK